MFKTSRKKKSRINIIPMIDVIFFLLVFFMLFTSFRTNPFGMEMQLPEAATATEQTEDHMVINISEQGEFYLQEEQVNLPQLRAAALEEYEANPAVNVILNADRNSRYESVITVMDNLREVGIYNIFLAAERED